MSRVVRLVCHVTLVVLLAMGVCPVHAQAPSPYADALRRAEYQISLADLNGDGRDDLLLLAKRVIVILPLDDDLLIPLALPPPSPTFILWSQSDGTYTMDSTPASSTITHPAWQLTSDYALVFGDILGNGIGAMLISAHPRAHQLCRGDLCRKR